MSKFKSRKLLVTIGAMVTVLLTNVVGLPESQAATVTDALTIIVGIFLGSQGAADAAGALKRMPV